MARAPNEKLNKALSLYQKGYKLVDIAKELDIPAGTVRRWKKTYNWGNGERSEKENNKSERSVKRCSKKNTKQCSDKATSRLRKDEYPTLARPNNKNAVTTGEFETLFFDTLDNEELILVEKIKLEKANLLKQEIQLLTVRERRMLKRINSLKDKEMTVVSTKSGIEKGQDTDLTEYKGTLDQIQNIEEALTRVQEKKQKAIDLIHKFELDEQKLELAKIKSGAYEEEEEVEDDGFIAALGNKVTEVWSDEENS